MKAFKLALKIFLGIIVLLVLLALIGYFALTRWINPNIFKPQIITLVHQATGRDLVLSGDLSWTFYPNLGIHIGTAALSNPAGLNQATFASIDSADLLLNWNALLHGQIEINDLVVNGLQLALVSDGVQDNWTFTSVNNAAQTASTPGKQKLQFSLHQVTLNDANITYDNYQTKSHYVINNLQLSIPDFSLTTPMNIKAQGDLKTDNLSSAFKVNMLFYYDPDKNSLSLNNLALSSSSTYTNDGGTAYPFSLESSGSLNLDLDQQILNLQGVNFTLNQNLQGQVNLTVKNFKQFNYSGHMNIPAFALGDFLNTFSIALPNIPNKDQFNNTSLQTDFSGNLHSLMLKNLALGFGNTQMTGMLSLGSFSPLALQENLKVNQIDLADFTNLNGARLPMSGIHLKGILALEGFDSSDFPSTLNAAQTLNIQDIILKGFDLKVLLNNLDTMISHILNVKKSSDAYQAIQNDLNEFQDAAKVSVNASNGKQTDFGSLSAQILIHNGVMVTPNVVVSGPLVKITGQGRVDLNQKNLNYQLNTKILASDRDLIKSLNIPYNLSGPFNNIQQGVDWPSVQAQIMKFIAGQLGQTVTSLVTTVVTTPFNVAGGTVKGIGGALSHIFGDKPAAS